MTLSVGIIGTGVMGAEHARILREDTPGVVLSGVFDADSERAQLAAGPHAEIFEDAKALIRSDKVHAVVISSPDQTHAELVLECIAVGKPVLCEKPLGVTIGEARRVVDAEVALGKRLVQMGYMRRFDPGYMELARRYREKQLGDALIMHNTHRNAVAPDWYTAEMSITNAFVHEIDAARWMLASEMASVHVQNAGRADPLLLYMSSVNDVTTSSEIFMNCSYGYHVATQLVGSRGTAETVDPLLTRVNLEGALRADYAQIWIPRFRQAYCNQIVAWARTAATGVANEGANAWDGYVNCVVADCSIRSLEDGARVEIPSLETPSLYDERDEVGL